MVFDTRVLEFQDEEEPQILGLIRQLYRIE